MRFDAIIFDKDGTLLDFERTWAETTARCLHEMAPDESSAHAVAALFGFDLRTNTFHPGASAISDSNETLAELASRHLDGWALIDLINEQVLDTVTAAPHADAVVRELRRRRIPIAVATNDEEAGTLRQLEALGWAGFFDVVVGYDSGHGAKPSSGMVSFAATSLGMSFERTAMVGDSDHDLVAARAAGVSAVLIGDAASDDAPVDLRLRDLRDLLSMAGEISR